MEKRAFGVIAGTLLSVALAGCGSDSSDSKDSVGADVQVTTAVTDAGPITLTTTTYSGANTTIELNQTASGSMPLEADGEAVYLFTAPQGGYISIMLEGSASFGADLDLIVSDLDGTLNSDGTENYWSTLNSVSKELAIINLEQGHQYEITIENWGSVTGEDYSLTVSNLSRDQLGLENNEYLVVFSEKGTENCQENRLSPETSYSDYWVSIANFKSEYMDSLEDKVDMSLMSASAFKLEVDHSENYTDEGISGTYSSTFVMNGTFASDNASADLTFSRTFKDVSDEPYTNECTSSATGTMKFLL